MNGGLRITLGMVAAMMLGMGGCTGSSIPSSAATSSTTEAKVSGTVKILGKNAEAGRVVFDPANVNRPGVASRIAKIDKDGHYEITTLVGLNQVSVDGKGISDNRKVGYISKSFDVHSGTNTFDINAP